MDAGAVNLAVVAYLADGAITGDLARKGPDFADARTLQEAVMALVRESMLIPAHWDTTAPLAGAVIVKREMKRRYELLDDLALEALAQNFVAASLPPEAVAARR